MDLLQKILECSDEELDLIINKAIIESNNKATHIDKLGFVYYNKANAVFKGFIPLKTRIKYSTYGIEDYSMDSTDFFYEFAQYIKQNNINNKVKLIYGLEYFINDFFGFPGENDREEIFRDIAFRSTQTDDEFFDALDNNKIGDLKKKGAAECTERAALAEQILSLFGFESYYCIGCLDIGDSQFGHCFNIVKRKNDYALLDYSVPITQYNVDDNTRYFYPFVGIISNEELESFIDGGTIKSFNNYYINGKQKVQTDNKRMYVVNQFEIEKEDYKGMGL